jgi:hypothetical protein
VECVEEKNGVQVLAQLHICRLNNHQNPATRVCASAAEDGRRCDAVLAFRGEQNACTCPRFVRVCVCPGGGAGRSGARYRCKSTTQCSLELKTARADTHIHTHTYTYTYTYIQVFVKQHTTHNTHAQFPAAQTLVARFANLTTRH